MEAEDAKLRASALAEEITSAPASIQEHRNAIAAISLRRAAAARELVSLVGATSAAALVGVHRVTMYKIAGHQMPPRRRGGGAQPGDA